MALTSLDIISNLLNTELLAPEPGHASIRKAVNRLFWLNPDQISAQLVAAAGRILIQSTSSDPMSVTDPTLVTDPILIPKPSLTQVLQLLCKGPRLTQSLRLDIDGLLVRWGRGVYNHSQRMTHRKSRPKDHGFIVGDCWASWRAMRLEGAHAHARSGIQGNRFYGAHSVVLNGGYTNRDRGDDLSYWGTKPKGSKPSARTNQLRRSLTTGNPVRVIRGPDTDIAWRTRKGFRYDGLYRVVGEEEERGQPGNYLFHLIRLKGQPDIQKEKPDDLTMMSWERYC